MEKHIRNVNTSRVPCTEKYTQSQISPNRRKKMQESTPETSSSLFEKSVGQVKDNVQDFGKNYPLMLSHSKPAYYVTKRNA